MRLSLFQLFFFFGGGANLPNDLRILLLEFEFEVLLGILCQGMENYTNDISYEVNTSIKQGIYSVPSNKF